MIKIGFRPNLIYLLMLIIFNFLRKIDSIVMDKVLEFDSSILFTLIMFLGEFIAGFILYTYEISFLSKKKNNTFMGIKLIKGPSDISHPDSNFKIYLLLFMASFFDFIEFIMSTFYLPRFEGISQTLEMRLSSILIISSALFFYFLLKFPIFKHQMFSLLIIFICLIIIVIMEFFFQVLIQERSLKDYCLILLLIFLMHFFDSLLDSSEKYLLEYDFLNPFKTLMIEGIFGTILTSICAIIYSIFDKNPFKDIVKYYYAETNTKFKFILLIICLAFYLFLSGGRNAYRVATNKIYSPMAKSLTDYCLNPLLLIYYFIFAGDFKANEDRQYIIFFIFNFILSIIIVFCALVYNELLILVCYNLEYNTHREVSIRANTKENIEMEENQDGAESDGEKDDNNSDDS